MSLRRLSRWRWMRASRLISSSFMLCLPLCATVVAVVVVIVNATFELIAQQPVQNRFGVEAIMEFGAQHGFFSFQAEEVRGQLQVFLYGFVICFLGLVVQGFLG